MRRRVVATLAWVGTLLALAPSPMPAPARPADDVVRVTAQRLDDLVRRITGNVEEKQASELLHHHRAQDAVAACMARAGRPYRKATFVSFFADFTDADLGYGVGRASLIDSMTEGGRRLVLNEMAYARLDRQRLADFRRRIPPADKRTYYACMSSSRVGHDIEPPPGAYELLHFDGLIGPPSGELTAAVDTYRPCMKTRYGYDVDDRSDFLFRPRIDRSDAPVDGRPANAAWTRGLAEIDAAFTADADCRRPAYVLAMQRLATVLDDWEREHRAELDAIRAAWRQRVADAAHLPRQ
jgi:hypothetical protein